MATPGPSDHVQGWSKIPSIKAWFRWRSTRTAMAYINCSHPGRIGHPFTTPTPPQIPQGEAMDCGNSNQAMYGVLGP